MSCQSDGPALQCARRRDGSTAGADGATAPSCRSLHVIFILLECIYRNAAGAARDNGADCTARARPGEPFEASRPATGCRPPEITLCYAPTVKVSGRPAGGLQVVQRRATAAGRPSTSHRALAPRRHAKLAGYASGPVKLRSAPDTPQPREIIVAAWRVPTRALLRVGGDTRIPEVPTLPPSFGSRRPRLRCRDSSCVGLRRPRTRLLGPLARLGVRCSRLPARARRSGPRSASLRSEPSRQSRRKRLEMHLTSLTPTRCGCRRCERAAAAPPPWPPDTAAAADPPAPLLVRGPPAAVAFARRPRLWRASRC